MSEAGLSRASQPGASDRRLQKRRVTSIQLMLAVALAFGLVLGLNFSGRITLDRDLNRIHSRFSAEIDSLLAVQRDLIEELNYVKSDAYVEYWARDEGKMIREGEVLIMPKSAGSPSVVRGAPAPLVEFRTTASEPENWQLWWALFFDAPPPKLDDF